MKMAFVLVILTMSNDGSIADSDMRPVDSFQSEVECLRVGSQLVSGGHALYEGQGGNEISPWFACIKAIGYPKP